MSSARPQSALLLDRALGVTGLLGLAAVTLVDPGTSRMYAAPWNLGYWGAVLAPLLLLILRVISPDRTFRLPAPAWLAFVATAWVVVIASAIASPYGAPCLQWSALPLAGLAVFLLVHDWLQADPENRLRLANRLALAGGALVLASTAYWLADLSRMSPAKIFSATLFDHRNPHPLGHSNYTAALALLALPWLVQVARRSPGVVRLAAGTTAALALVALFASGSRGGLLGLAALGIAAVACARLGWKRFMLLAAAAVIAAGVLAVANPRIRALLGPTGPGAAPNSGSVQRRAMLEAGWRMGADRPGLGWGLGTTPLVYPRYRATLAGGAENVLQLHSTPVELWAGLGAAGVLLWAGFVGLAATGWSRAPVAAATLAGYGVLTLTDYQLDVPVLVGAVAILAAQLAAPGPEPAVARRRKGLALAVLGTLAVIAIGGRGDPTPRLNAEALDLARGPAQQARAIELLRASLALNPDQEIAHFNLGWLLVVADPAAAEKHFRQAARLVPDKGGVYFGLGLARLNQGRAAEAAPAFALECLNDPTFLASPWWKEPAVAGQRAAAQDAFVRLAQRARDELPPGSWAARQAGLLAGLAPRLGQISAGPELDYRRERTGYPVLTRNHDRPPPVDLFDVREDPRFVASVSFPLPPKGWLPGPLLLKLLDARAPDGH